MERLADSLSNFLAYRKHNTEGIKPIFKMNMTEVSCDRADPTFAPFQQNDIKKLEVFRNNLQTIVSIPFNSQAGAEACHWLYTREDPGLILTRDTVVKYLFFFFFGTHFSSDFWITGFKIRLS